MHCNAVLSAPGVPFFTPVKHHLVSIQTKQDPRPILSALAAPCPETPLCLETFVNLNRGIPFLINKESLLCFFPPIHLALKLLSCFVAFSGRVWDY